MKRLVGLTREQLELRERVLEGLVTRVLRQTVKTLTLQPLTAAGEPPAISTTAAVAGAEAITATLPPLELATVPTTWQSYVAAELYPFLVETYLAAGAATAEAVQETLGVLLPQLTQGAAEAYLASARNRLAGIGDDLWNQLRTQLAEGYSAGESTHQLAARIRETAELTEPRALVIARTEVIPAANAASLEQLQLAFTDEECSKEWLATTDDRTREAHRKADGQRVPLHQAFDVGGEALPYPGWPGGSPENVIQCRCSLAFVFADDAGEDNDLDSLVADAAFEKHHPRDAEGQFTDAAAPKRLSMRERLQQKARAAKAAGETRAPYAPPKQLDVTKFDPYFNRESGVVSGSDLNEHFKLTHTTGDPDVIRAEGFQAKKGSKHGQLLGRATYVALDDATRSLYEGENTETLRVRVAPSAKFLSVSAGETYGALRDSARLLPGGEKQWRALVGKYAERGTTYPEAAALRQLARAEGYAGLVIRDTVDVGKDKGFRAGGNQVVIWDDENVSLLNGETLTAAVAQRERTWTPTDESKHKRDARGRFARKTGAASGGRKLKLADVLAADTGDDAEKLDPELAADVRDAFTGKFAGLRTGDVVVKPGRKTSSIKIEGTIFDAAGNDVGLFTRIIRTLKFGDVEAEHVSLLLNEDVQGQGFAQAFNRHVFNWYRESGVSRVRLLADSDVGGYAWAREGYDWQPDDVDGLLDMQERVNLARQDGSGILNRVPAERRDEQRRLAQQLYLDVADTVTEDTDPDTELPDVIELWPTPFELSQLGRWPGAGRDDWWIGKAIMMDSNWWGVRYLDDADA